MGETIPRFIGGPMSLPSGSTLVIQVDNGGTETVAPGAEWSIGTG